MIRFLFRMLGYLLLAGAFVAAVIDGTRSIASSGLQLTSVQMVLERGWSTLVPSLRAATSQVHPLLWDPVAQGLLHAPVAVVLFVVGLVFALMSSPREPDVGIVARR